MITDVTRTQLNRKCNDLFANLYPLEDYAAQRRTVKQHAEAFAQLTDTSAVSHAKSMAQDVITAIQNWLDASIPSPDRLAHAYKAQGILEYLHKHTATPVQAVELVSMADKLFRTLNAMGYKLAV